MLMSQVPTPDYRPPRSEPREAMGDLGAPQAVFDTVAGPNLRLRDNLIQLGCVVVGGVLGVVGAMMVERTVIALVIGGLIGFVAGGIFSGAVLGIYRGVLGVRRMGKK